MRLSDFYTEHSQMETRIFYRRGVRGSRLCFDAAEREVPAQATDSSRSPRAQVALKRKYADEKVLAIASIRWV